MKKVTLKDIAKRAKTAVSTVSLVVNGKKRVDAKTRARIQRIIKKLNYYPDESAKKLISGKSDEIAFIATRHASPFIAQVLDSFEQRARDLDKYVYGIRTFSTFNKPEYTADLLKSLLYGRNIDGVVLLTQPADKKVVAEYEARKVPLLMVENSQRGVYSIKIDNKTGVELAVKRFAETGKNNIGLIIGKIDPICGEQQSPVVMERYASFIKSMSKHGLKFNKDNVFYVRYHNQVEGHEAFNFFNSKKKLPDAVFCAAGDLTAIGFIEAAMIKKVKIPDDVAIIGYDDIPAAGILSIPLTTIRQPLEKMGEIVFDTLMDAIKDKRDMKKDILLKPEIVIRKSG